MGTGYTRNDTANNIADGNIINASDLDGEFDAVQSAFNNSSGHTHDGTAGEGAPIETIGPSQDVVATASVLRPKTDNTVDLGTTSLEYKDLFLDGTAHIDTLDVDENASITGTLGVTGTTTLGTANITTGTITTADINGGNIDGTIIGASSAAAITGTTITGTSFVTSGDMTFGDNDKAVFGAGSDLQIYHDGSNSYIDEAAAGDLYIRAFDRLKLNNYTDNAAMLNAKSGAEVELYYNGGLKLATTSTGVDITGNVTFADNGKAIFGAGSDLQIYHNPTGSHSYITESGGGSLYIQGTELNLTNSAGTSTYANFVDGGAAFIRHAGSTKLATTSTGVDITGTLTSDGLTVSQENPKITITDTGTGADHELNGASSIGNLTLNFDKNDDGSSPYFYIQHAGNKLAAFRKGGDISFYEDTGTTAKFFWDASAESLGIGTSSIQSNVKMQIVGEDGSSGASANVAANELFVDNNGNAGVTVGTSNTGVGYYAFADSDVALRGGIFYNHTDDAMGFRVLSEEAMRIDSSGRVGIGRTPTSNLLEVADTIKLTNLGTGEGFIGYNTNGQKLSITATDAVGAGMKFEVGSSEAMRIDSSGNLLVGKTSADNTTQGIRLLGSAGFASFVRAEAEPIVVNRLTDDGDLIEFRKDGAPVGSIGSLGGVAYMNSGDVGFSLDWGSDQIKPRQANGANRDAAIDLGASASRFKDLYLSGTVNAATLNVDGGTIKLDGNYPTGTNNVALGNAALDDGSLSGGYNVAIGVNTFTNNTSGQLGTAVGNDALFANTTGSYNTGVGGQSLGLNTTGSSNVGVGRQALYNNTTASENTAVGYQSLYSNQTGVENSALGRGALYNNLSSYNTSVGRSSMYNNTTGNRNVALGVQALLSNTTASNNTAVGYQAAQTNTTGSALTAIGYQALGANTTGSNNTAVGYQANSSNTTGIYNVSLGLQALLYNTTGGSNTALGYQSLQSNNASHNVAVGQLAMFTNTTGQQNTAVGSSALYSNTTANGLVAVGRRALEGNTTGANNSAHGYEALKVNTTGANNSAHGYGALQANTTASNSTAVGYKALYSNTTTTGNTAIGYQALLNNTGSSRQVAVGYRAMENATTAQESVAVGYDALQQVTSGQNNTAIGYNSLDALTTNSNNTAVGASSGTLVTGQGNTFIGSSSGHEMTSGNKNTILGRYSGNQGGVDIRTASNNIILSDGDGNPFYWGRGSGTHVYSSETGAATAFVSAINSTNTSSQIFRGSNSASNINDVGADQFVVFGTGNVQNTNNSYGAISDQKLKENIIDVGSQWDDIKAIRVRKYSLIADSETTANRLGVIAQELEASGMSGLVEEHMDLGPNDEDLGTTTKGVKYSVLYMKAVKALQEAMDRIETLETKVATLEGN